MNSGPWIKCPKIYEWIPDNFSTVDMMHNRLQNYTNMMVAEHGTQTIQSCGDCVVAFAIITIFVNLGPFWHFETVTNIRHGSNHTHFGECCKMQILQSGCSYQEPN